MLHVASSGSEPDAYPPFPFVVAASGLATDSGAGSKSIPVVANASDSAGKGVTGDRRKRAELRKKTLSSASSEAIARDCQEAFSCSAKAI